jgi:spore germination protein KC
MRKKFFVGIGMMLLCLALGGCWDIRHLDQLSIVLAMALDKGEGQNIQITVQVVNPAQVSAGGAKGGGGGGGGSSPVTTYSETGQTVFEAIRKISNKTSRRLYFAHNQALVIGEELARTGTLPLFEFIERDPEVRTDFYVVVAKGAKAADVLKITTPIEKIPATKIRENVENVEKNWGTSYGVRIQDIVENIGSETKEMVTGSIEIVGDIKKGESNQNVGRINPMTTIKLSGMAVFKNAKLVDFLYLKESRGLGWTQNKIKNTVVNVPCQREGNVAIEVIHSSTTMKAKFQQGQPSMVIRVVQEANVGENLCPEMDLSKEETFNQLQTGMKEEITKEILAAVKKAQNLNTDILGFAEAVYRTNPAYWKKNKNNWDNVFDKIPVQIEVNTEIRREGIRNKSIVEKLKRSNKE